MSAGHGLEMGVAGVVVCLTLHWSGIRFARFPEGWLLSLGVINASKLPLNRRDFYVSAW